MTDKQPPPSLGNDHVQQLIGQLAAAESALHLIGGGGVDAVLDPSSGNLILLRQAQEALVESQGRYLRLLDRMAVVIFELDPAGTTLFVNEAVARVTGYAPEELIGRSWWDTFFPGELRTQLGPLLDQLCSGNVSGRELNVANRAGTPITLEFTSANRFGPEGALQRIVGFCLDVTRRKVAEENLRASEERYRVLVENANDILFTHDLKGNCTSFNKAGELLSGFTSDEIRQVNLAQLVVPEDRHLLSEMLAHKLNHGGKTTCELGLQTRDGRRLTVEISTNLIYQDGQPVGVQGIARDVTERKLSEERLRESERRFRETLENAHLAAVMLDLEGTVHFCNEYLLNLSHYRREEVLGQNWFDLFRPPSQKAQARCEYQEQVRVGALPTYAEQVLMTRRGERRLIAWNHTLLRDVTGAVIGTCGIGADVTESRHVEEALRLRDRALEAFSQGILITDPAQLDNPIIYANPAFERITGYAASEVLGRNPRFLNGPDTDPAVIAELNQATQEGRETSVEVLNYRKDGTPFWNLLSIFPVRDDTGRVTHFCGTQMDITERKRMSKAFQESEERHRILFENDLTGDYLATPDGRLIACNAAFAHIFGFASVEEALQANPQSFYPDPRKRHELIQLLRVKKNLNHLEMDLRRRDGQAIQVIKTLVGIFDERGELVQVAGYVFDITERRQLEDQLRQAQKMEAVGRLAGGVAHDFNNLLTVISGYSEILLSRLKPHDPQYEPLREIRKAGDRAAGLTRQLLAFSRRQVLAPVVLNLNTVLQEMEKMLRRLIGEDIELTTRLAPDLNQVRADPGQIEQVLLNLVVNARDAMPTGGKLAIESTNTTLDEAYSQQYPDVRPGPYAMLTVTDNGCGMDEATQARIFEPFFTTKEIGKGTGLGLAMVYGILKQSGGHIDVSSRPGRGSTFRIYLPLIPETARAAGSEPGLYKILRGTETVLLVEDEDGVRALARLILQSSGYTVLEAANGREALQLVNQHAGPLHLLITDVVMPQMSGRQLADLLQSRRPAMKVLYISGYTDDAVVRHGVSGTTMPFLHKPFTPASLSRKVREVLGP